MIINYHDKIVKEVKLRNLLDIFLWGYLKQRYDIEIIDFFSYMFVPYQTKDKFKLNQILNENKTMRLLNSLPTQVIVFKFIEGVERNSLLLDIKAITKQKDSQVINIRDKDIETLKKLQDLQVFTGILLYVANSEEKFYLDIPLNIIQASDKKIKNGKMSFYAIDISRIFTLYDFLDYHFSIDAEFSKQAIQKMLEQIETNNYFEELRSNLIKSESEAV